jgi:hypothetical protein
MISASELLLFATVVQNIWHDEKNSAGRLDAAEEQERVNRLGGYAVYRRTCVIEFFPD